MGFAYNAETKINELTELDFAIFAISLGISSSTLLYSFLSGETDQVHDADYVMGWEIFSNLAIQQGDWKITQRPVNPMAQSDSKVEWELYNIKNGVF